MTKTNQKLITKIEQQLDWALFLAHLIKAKTLESQTELHQAITELWMAICVINKVEDEESVCMLNHLSLACRLRPIFCDTAPLLLGIAALHADQSGNLRKREQLLSAAFRLSPFDEELLALVERRNWQSCWVFIFNNCSINQD